MTALGERLNTRKAFATPWEVRYDIAYPPSMVLGGWRSSYAKATEDKRAMDADCAAVVLSHLI